MRATAKRVIKGLFAVPSIELTKRWHRCSPLVRVMRRLNGIQLSVPELQLILGRIRARRPCNLLVFGLGNDSRLWARANSPGTTVFLEDDREWFERVHKRAPELKAMPVDYRSTILQWRELLDDPGRLEMELPEEIRRTPWDVILVDGPAGWGMVPECPGRMRSIYAASTLAGPGTDVFVHDCDREVEGAYVDRYFTDARFRERVDRLCQFRFRR